MSDSTNTSNTPQGGGGLNKSTPLVTVQNVHSGVKTAVTLPVPVSSTNIDHPLATPPPAPSPSQTLSPSVELSQRATLSPAASPSAAKTPTSPPPPPPPAAPTVAKLPKKNKATPKKQASSLEEMADEFLSKHEEGIAPKLKPTPLPKDQEGIERLRTLVVRRAWGDVLSVCGQMLRGPTSPYTQLYTSLVSDSNEVDLEGFTSDQEEEMVEILTLECHAWLKLRRYNELGREIDKWNFLHHNTTSDSPSSNTSSSSSSWVPWSLRK